MQGRRAPRGVEPTEVDQLVEPLPERALAQHGRVRADSLLGRVARAGRSLEFEQAHQPLLGVARARVGRDRNRPEQASLFGLGQRWSLEHDHARSGRGDRQKLRREDRGDDPQLGGLHSALACLARCMRLFA